MNRSQRSSMLLAVLAMTFTAAVAQEIEQGALDLSWNTVDGGGGDSAGGTFELSGTAGQTDAGLILAGGSFELRGGFWPGTLIPCPPDTNGDGNVDVIDLLAVISAWGACGNPNNCPADVNNDDLVNVIDLLAVINGWGACP